MNPRICIRCQKEIKDKENYMQIIEWDLAKLKKENFCHKHCWEELMTRKKSIANACNLLDSLMNKARDEGLIIDNAEVFIP